ncbi:MAG: YegS/Rv2252/BmrU family lipid kinase [Actinobacteria bacterium]|nr:YegS/Rv2252/BmrU family lipid kinase [Actinomycetota bacterium]
MQQLNFVVNPAASRTGRRSQRTGLADRLVAAALAVNRAAIVHQPTTVDASRLILASIAAEGADRVAVVGGDGAVHVAANVLRTTDTALAVIPFGTGNDAATALGISMSLDRAVAGAIGPIGRIDLINIGGTTWAVTIATAGFSVDVNERAEALRWPGGSWAYTIATVLEIPKRVIRPMTITTDGIAVHHDATFVAIANTHSFGGGMRIAPDAKPDDGLLDVVVVGGTPRRDLIRLLPAARKGKHVSDPRVSVTRGREIRLESRETTVLRADGEVIAPLPLDLTVDRAALQVVGPNRAH